MASMEAEITIIDVFGWFVDVYLKSDYNVSILKQQKMCFVLKTL